MVGVPNYQSWGIRSWQDWYGRVRVTHRWNDWRSTEADADKLHLCDRMRACLVARVREKEIVNSSSFYYVEWFLNTIKY